MDWKEIQTALAEPLPPDEIEWRVGSTTKDKKKGLALAYMTARAVHNRLDAVVGCQNWYPTYEHGAGKGVVCTLFIRKDEDSLWVGKEDAADETDIESTKGGVSSALKRAAAVWGIGRYLYYLDSPWCELDDYKRIKRDPPLPAWALPGGAGRPSGGSARPAPAGAKSQTSRDQAPDPVDHFTSPPPAPKPRLPEGVISQAQLTRICAHGTKMGLSNEAQAAILLQFSPDYTSRKLIQKSDYEQVYEAYTTAGKFQKEDDDAE